MYVIVTCKYEKDLIKSIQENMMTPFFPLLLYGSYLLPWKPEFWPDLDQNVLKSFPHPNDASDKISFQSANWLQRYSCLKVITDGRTPARPVYYKLTNEPSAQVAFGSGELKNTRLLFFHEESIHEVSRRYLIPECHRCKISGSKILKKGNNSKNILWIYSFLHQIFYSSSPISWHKF